MQKASAPSARSVKKSSETISKVRDVRATYRSTYSMLIRNGQPRLPPLRLRPLDYAHASFILAVRESETSGMHTQS